MKKLILVFSVVLIAQTGFGQVGFDLGLKAGLNNSKITFDSHEYTRNDINNFHFGAFGRVGIGRFYVQPEAYYISKGGDIHEIVNDNPLQTISSFNYDMIDVPVLAGFTIVKGKAFNLRVLGGPVFSFVTDSEVDGDAQFSSEYFKDNFIGWQYGAGVDVLFFTLDARIEQSAGDVYSGSGYSAGNKTLLISLGIKIL